MAGHGRVDLPAHGVSPHSAWLAGDQKPEGVVGGPLELIVYPGKVIEFHEILDPQTTHLGLVADYYRTAADPPGTRKVVVPADCGMVDVYLRHAKAIDAEILRRLALGRLAPVWLAPSLPPLM